MVLSASAADVFVCVFGGGNASSDDCKDDDDNVTHWVN